MKEALEKHSLLDGFPYDAIDSQVAVFTKAPNRGNSSVYMSFFYHLRNAIAHARFAVFTGTDGRWVFAFEDGANSKGSFTIKARGVIRVDSLLSIVDLIEAGPEAKPDVVKVILDVIRGGLVTKKRIKEELELSDSDWCTYSQVFRKEGKIECDKQHRWSVVAEAVEDSDAQ